MGGRSKSSTSTKTVTNTQNLNLQGVGAPTVVGDGRITITETDQGAVQAAFQAIDSTTAQQQATLRAANEAVAGVANRANDTVARVAETAIEQQRGAQQDAFQFANRVQSAAYQWAQDASTSEAARITDTLSKWAIGAASVVALGMVLRGK